MIVEEEEKGRKLKKNFLRLSASNAERLDITAVLVTSLKSVSFAIVKTMWWKPALNRKNHNLQRSIMAVLTRDWVSII